MKKRYYTLDYIRGIALFNMILFHTFWDLVYLFNFNMPWFNSDVAYIWQQCICYTFILLSGFCYSLSNNKFKRGLIVFCSGLLITLVTELLMPENHIYFGVLTFIGSCMLLLIPFYKQLNKLNPYIGLCIFIILFVLTRNVNDGYLGFESINIFKLPSSLYKNLFTAYIGFPNINFYSSDYFSIIPWIFLFVCGFFIKKIFEKRNKLYLLEKRHNYYIELFGKNSLAVYILHQPLIYLILLIVAS